jgi:hypothetical protein
MHGARSHGNAQQVGVYWSLLVESGYHEHASARLMRSLSRQWIVLPEASEPPRGNAILEACQVKRAVGAL